MPPPANAPVDTVVDPVWQWIFGGLHLAPRMKSLMAHHDLAVRRPEAAPVADRPVPAMATDQ